MTKVLQIIPAANIVAVFLEDGKEVSYPVVCWQFQERKSKIDDEPFQMVVGLIIEQGTAYLVEVDESTNFFRYEYI